VHEVTSPQAFEGCGSPGASRGGPDRSWRLPTTTRRQRIGTAGIADPISRTQVETLDANMKAHGAKAIFRFAIAGRGSCT
jgi:3-isopropylmalate/(R)-2-methylmalate dehydratase large subunit